jgi:hypothetical protein
MIRRPSTAIMTLDTFIGIAGLALGILGLASGYIFYRRSLKIKQPLYLMRTENLIQDNIATISGLKITYNDHVVSNLSTSTIAFWNNGSETISDLDRVISNPLRISASRNARVLNAKIIFSHIQSNRLSVEIDDTGSNVYLLFDYLDKGHGGIIQVIHTGLSSRDLSITGDVKGALVQEISPGRDPWSVTIGLLLPHSFTVAAIEVTLLLYIFGIWVPSPPPYSDALAIAISATLPLIPLIDHRLYQKWRQNIFSPLPKSFRGFWSS